MLKSGRSLNEFGYIGNTSERKNEIITNSIGALAFHNHMYSYVELEVLICNLHYEANMEFKASEKSNNGHTLTREFAGFTPFLLAVVGGISHLCIFIYIYIYAN